MKRKGDEVHHYVTLFVVVIVVFFPKCKFGNMRKPTKTHVQEKGNRSKLQRSVRPVVTNPNSGDCFTSYISVPCLMETE
jgi:endonuclease V-like protein UPF0215 family